MPMWYSAKAPFSGVECIQIIKYGMIYFMNDFVLGCIAGAIVTLIVMLTAMILDKMD